MSCNRYLCLVIIFVVLNPYIVICRPILPIQTYNADMHWGKDIVFSPDGSKIITSSDIYIKIWNILTGELINSIDISHFRLGNVLRNVAISKDGSLIVLGEYNNENAELWDINSSSLIKEFGPHDPWWVDLSHFMLAVTDVDISSDNRWILTRDLGTPIARLWDVSTGEQIHSFPSPLHGWVLGFTPDMKYIDSGGKIWDFNTKELIYNFKKALIYSIDISSNSKYVAYGEVRLVSLYDLESGMYIYGFTDHPPTASSIDSVSFSPDNSMIACGYDGSTEIRLFETISGKSLANFDLGAWNTSVAFHPDGTKILTSGPEGKAYLWNLSDILAVHSGIAEFEAYKK